MDAFCTSYYFRVNSIAMFTQVQSTNNASALTERIPLTLFAVYKKSSIPRGVSWNYILSSHKNSMPASRERHFDSVRKVNS
jgi:hypothetical protein